MLVPPATRAARNMCVAQARKAGDKELAATIAALRKPTVAAWAAGLLTRRRPVEAEGLLQLGEALRTAHRTLDAEQLRKLSHDQHAVIGQLARTARALAAEAGQMVSEPVLHEVEQILHAVLADGDVAVTWAAGRLVKAPDAVLGFAGLEPQQDAVAPRSKPAAAGEGTARERAGPRARKADADEAAVRARRERVEAARADLAEAEAEVEKFDAGCAAEQKLVDSAAAAVAAAQEEVEAANEQLRHARAASADATARHREAGRAAAKARARAETAARKIEKLTSFKG
ncbi:hypothetical protein ACM614_07330 [Streptomyces sp. 12297]